jgi:Ca2+/Na+ antiporter
MLFGLMGLLLIVEVKRESREAILKLLFLASVLHVAWTSQQLIGGLFIQLLFSVSMKVSYPKELKIQTWLTMNVLMAALLVVSYYSFPGHTDKINFYHMQTFLVLFIWFVVVVLHSEKSRNLAENH